MFTFKENAPDAEMKYTKRNFLKKIATLFDPVVLLAPFTIRAKILLQEMWMAGLNWDEELTEPLANSAQVWFSELPDLTQIQIPRCPVVKGKQIDKVSLHTFADASEDAYGAVAHVRCSYQDGAVSTNIVADKTRVAPSKATSIPRLELMGAVIWGPAIDENSENSRASDESANLLVGQSKCSLVDTRAQSRFQTIRCQ